MRSDRHVLTLTAFVKQRENERREAERARRAMQSRKGEELMATDFQTLRERRQATFSEADRVEYARAYAESSLAADLAELVYTLRTEASLTRTELARRMGTTQSCIARIEAGRNTPTLDLLDRLGEALAASLTLTVAGHAVVFGAPAA